MPKLLSETQIRAVEIYIEHGHDVPPRHAKDLLDAYKELVKRSENA